MSAREDEWGLAAAESLLMKRKYLRECKFKIAQFCSAIMQNPDENVGRLRDLTKMATDKLFMRSSSLRQILVASLCVVFKDVLPTYQIRLPTEKELKQKVRKETKRTWRFEEILLKNYEKYVLLLQTILKDKARRKLPKSLSGYNDQKWTKTEVVSALKCACSLFETNPLFNFANNLLGAVLPYLQKSKLSTRQIVFKSLKATFASDVTGDATLLVCRGVHRLARGLKYRIHPDIVNVIAGISIKEVVDPSVDNKAFRRDRRLASRRERKKDKLMAKFEKDQAESKASRSHDERLRKNSEILKEILFVYFTVLKSTKNSDLLSAVLAGLSTYAHIINVEYVENLLQLLSGYIVTSKTSLQDSLHSVYTALSILTTSSAASVLKVDPTRFYNHLYTLLGRLASVCLGQASNATTSVATAHTNNHSQFTWSHTPAALAAQTLDRRERLLAASGGDDSEAGGSSTTASLRSADSVEVERFCDVILACLDMLLISRRREVSITRVLAFVKRLASLTTVVSDTACLASMLVSLWKFLSLFPKCEVLFDSETEIGGVYDPEAVDPELSRPASASLWELHILRNHESPLIRRLVGVVLKWMRQVVKGDAPRPTKDVLAAPDHTLESLSGLQPEERRVTLAFFEASCLSKPINAAGRQPSGRNRGFSSWMSQMIATFGLGQKHNEGMETD